MTLKEQLEIEARQLEGQEKQLVLLENLVRRMKYNESQNNYTLPGIITHDEYSTLHIVGGRYKGLVERKRWNVQKLREKYHNQHPLREAVEKAVTESKKEGE